MGTEDQIIPQQLAFEWLVKDAVRNLIGGENNSGDITRDAPERVALKSIVQDEEEEKFE